jgi:2'-5' RNA ligase
MDMYYLAVVLPTHLDEKVLGWKQFMKEQYDCKVGLKSPAHITIIPPFWMKPELEHALIQTADYISAAIPAFTIRTNNFSSFKPRTIFIAVADNIELNQLKEQAETAFSQQSAFGIKKENRPFHPHITIATRDLTKQAYFDAWPMFAEKSFIEEWMADGLSILKHNKKNWDVYHTSQFQQTTI